MKKAIAIMVSVLFVLSVAGLSFAAEKAAAEKKEAPAKTEKKAKAKVMSASGEVVAVDAKAMTLTVKGKKGEVALTVDDKTTFAKGKSLADVKVGDTATVKYAETDGKNVAKHVTSKAAKAKKETKKEMKKEEKKAEPKAAPAPKPAAAPAEKKKTGGY